MSTVIVPLSYVECELRRMRELERRIKRLSESRRRLVRLVRAYRAMRREDNSPVIFIVPEDEAEQPVS